MSKIGKALKAFGLILGQPSLLNLVLDHEENYKREVVARYQLEKGLKRIPFGEFLKETNTVEPFTFLEGGSLPTDYLLLAAMSKKLNKPACFEIGTWRGESALNMARYASHVHTLNLSKEELKQMGFDQTYADLQGSMCKDHPAISQLWGNSHSFDFSPYKNKYDLVFVDGDHHYKSVVNDTKIAFDLLKDDKSVIVWHDYGNGTETVRWEVLLGILDGTPADKRKHLYAVNNTLCAVYFPYPVESFTAVYPQKPSSVYSVRIEKK
ncbi:MAG: class SAM-dependent methyltransferase [Bacteroidetes bacterium]|jgi:predicted O-methyltransferase YrrM|nr:class SAM-dependent methyltransferase [Bacteroidota bacterium]